MRRQGGCKGLEGRSHPNAPACHGAAGQRGQRWKQQCQLTDTEAGNEDFDQTATRPTPAGKTFVERTEARGKGFRSRDTGAAPDGRMLEQPSQFGIDRH